MGIDRNYHIAFAKSQIAAGTPLPVDGTLFISINNRDKDKFLPIARKFHDLGMQFIATEGTSKYLLDHGIPNRRIFKVNEGHPNVVDEMINKNIQLVLNTFTGQTSRFDENAIRTAAVTYGVPLLTTISAARSAADAIKAIRKNNISVRALQDYHQHG